MKKQQGLSLVSLLIGVVILGIIAAVIGGFTERYSEKCIAGYTYIQDNVHSGITQVFGSNGPVPCKKG